MDQSPFVRLLANNPLDDAPMCEYLYLEVLIEETQYKEYYYPLLVFSRQNCPQHTLSRIAENYYANADINQIQTIFKDDEYIIKIVELEPIIDFRQLSPIHVENYPEFFCCSQQMDYAYSVDFGTKSIRNVDFNSIGISDLYTLACYAIPDGRYQFYYFDISDEENNIMIGDPINI